MKSELCDEAQMSWGGGGEGGGGSRQKQKVYMVNMHVCSSLRTSEEITKKHFDQS
jgi:hypothetical protein